MFVPASPDGGGDEAGGVLVEVDEPDFVVGRLLNVQEHLEVVRRERAILLELRYLAALVYSKNSALNNYVDLFQNPNFFP